MKKTTVYFPDELTERLERLARKSEIKAAEHIRRAVEAYLDKLEKKR